MKPNSNVWIYISPKLPNLFHRISPQNRTRANRESNAGPIDLQSIALEFSATSIATATVTANTYH